MSEFQSQNDVIVPESLYAAIEKLVSFLKSPPLLWLQAVTIFLNVHQERYFSQGRNLFLELPSLAFAGGTWSEILRTVDGTERAVSEISPEAPSVDQMRLQHVTLKRKPGDYLMPISQGMGRGGGASSISAWLGRCGK